MLICFSIVGGLSGAGLAQREELSVGKSRSVVLVVADDSNFISYLPCGSEPKQLTTIARGSVSKRVVLPFETKRNYPTIWKLVSRLLYIDGLDVGVRTTC